MFTKSVTTGAALFAFALANSVLGQTAPATSAPTSAPGYIPREALPDSLAILSGAPQAHSATQARDDAVETAFNAYRHGARWSLAALDADLSFPSAAGTYSCALGINVSPATTPRLYTMLERVRIDAGRSTGPAKNFYKRQRPFVVVGGATCRPEDEADLRNNGSYPSGHSTVGWSWALVLAEAAPDRGSEILHRGRAFLQSRVVCNAHWLSDTEAGALLAAAVVARLNDEPAFTDDLKASAIEIQAARALGQSASRNCSEEAAAMAVVPDQLP